MDTLTFGIMFWGTTLGVSEMKIMHFSKAGVPSL